MEKMKVVVEDRCWAAFGYPQNASEFSIGTIGFNGEKLHMKSDEVHWSSPPWLRYAVAEPPRPVNRGVPWLRQIALAH